MRKLILESVARVRKVLRWSAGRRGSLAGGPTPKGVKTKMVRSSALRPLGFRPKGKKNDGDRAPEVTPEEFAVAV